MMRRRGVEGLVMLRWRQMIIVMRSPYDGEWTYHVNNTRAHHGMHHVNNN